MRIKIFLYPQIKGYPISRGPKKRIKLFKINFNNIRENRYPEKGILFFRMLYM
jgi:hypothetical protein